MGKWMIVVREVNDIQKFDDNATVVTLKVIDLEPIGVFINLWFDPPWLSRLEVKQPPDRIVVLGRIELIETTRIDLHDCKLISN